jgi:hypothetical protein
MWLKVEPTLGSEYKITWGSGRDIAASYSIGAVAIRDAATRVRSELQALSICAKSLADARAKAEANAIENAVAIAIANASADAKAIADARAIADASAIADGNAIANAHAPIRGIMVALANAGKDLRRRLFDDPGKRPIIRELKDWICGEYENGDDELAIHPDSSIDVPWGLAYDGDVPSAIDPKDPEVEMKEFSGFWCLKYRLSAILGDYVRPKSKWTRPRETFGMLSLVNSDVKALLKDDLPKDLYVEFCEMLNPPVGEPESFDHCQTLIESTKPIDVLVHFLGHHSEQTLVLGEQYKITYDEFSELLDGLTGREELRGSRPCGLLFLNGCESAVGEKDFSLRRQASRPELCGAVATESTVRRKYAVLFGVHFLRSLLKYGKTVAATMYDLHNDSKLWPESLLYGCYAHPDYRIEPLKP